MSSEQTTANADEIAYWNDEPGLRWVALAERIEKAFAPLSSAVLTAAAVAPDEVVLDVGCGCGDTTLALSRLAGSGGSVAGVDVSRPMLAEAARRVRALGLDNVEFLSADASVHRFGDAAFDVVFSRFGVMFFDDPRAAFANLRPALRPSGRLVFVCWRELAANPWFHVPIDAVRAHVPPQPRPDAEGPGPLSFADPGRVRTILEGAGFTDIGFAAFDAQLPLGTLPAAKELLSKIGPAGRLVGGASDAERAVAIAALDETLRAYLTDGEVRLGAGVWVVSARP